MEKLPLVVKAQPELEALGKAGLSLETHSKEAYGMNEDGTLNKGDALGEYLVDKETWSNVLEALYDGADAWERERLGWEEREKALKQKINQLALKIEPLLSFYIGIPEHARVQKEMREIYRDLLLLARED